MDKGQSSTAYDEPSELELAIMDRGQIIGFPAIGPLTEEQFNIEKSFLDYMEESQAEHEAYVAAGCRSVCPKCGERSVKTSTVCTYGYWGAAGADYSALEECGNKDCDYKDLA